MRLILRRLGQVTSTIAKSETADKLELQNVPNSAGDRLSFERETDDLRDTAAACVIARVLSAEIALDDVSPYA